MSWDRRSNKRLRDFLYFLPGLARIGQQPGLAKALVGRQLEELPSGIQQVKEKPKKNPKIIVILPKFNFIYRTNI